jgi:hypothetical protein
MDNQKHSQLLLGFCLFGLVVTCQAAERSDVGLSGTEGLSLTVGLEYERGDYGTPYTTDVWRIPVGIDYVQGRLSAGVSTAYLNAKSTGTITVSSGRSRMSRVTTISSTTVSSASGMGDIDMYASYRLPTANEAEISYHVTGRIKHGTADENKGLGTGENDYALEAGLITKLAELYVYGNLGYQIVGDSATVNYDNVWYANAGTTYPLANQRSVGATLEVSQAATPGFSAPAQVTVFYNLGLAKQRAVYFYVLLGLSNGSPDSGVGVNLTTKL